MYHKLYIKRSTTAVIQQRKYCKIPIKYESILEQINFMS